MSHTGSSDDSAIPQAEPQLRLGELFRVAGAIDKDVLAEAVLAAKQTRMLLGKTLVCRRLINEQQLSTALTLQAVGRANKLHIGLVASAYNLVQSKKLYIAEALRKAEFEERLNAETRLGALLVDAHMITRKQLDEARERARVSDAPLGKVLCYLGFISETSLARALEVQSNIRNESITRENAVDALNQSPVHLLNKLNQSISGGYARLPQDLIPRGK